MKLLRKYNQLTATDQTSTPTGCGPYGGHRWLIEQLFPFFPVVLVKDNQNFSASSPALLQAMQAGPQVP